MLEEEQNHQKEILSSIDRLARQHHQLCEELGTPSYLLPPSFLPPTQNLEKKSPCWRRGNYCKKLLWI